jgi:hypothetical protein
MMLALGGLTGGGAGRAVRAQEGFDLPPLDDYTGLTALTANSSDGVNLRAEPGVDAELLLSVPVGNVVDLRVDELNTVYTDDGYAGGRSGSGISTAGSPGCTWRTRTGARTMESRVTPPMTRARPVRTLRPTTRATPPTKRGTAPRPLCSPQASSWPRPPTTAAIWRCGPGRARASRGSPGWARGT